MKPPSPALCCALCPETAPAGTDGWLIDGNVILCPRHAAGALIAAGLVAEVREAEAAPNVVQFTKRRRR